MRLSIAQKIFFTFCLIGEDWTDRTPEAERLTLKMGAAFDLRVEVHLRKGVYRDGRSA